MFMTNVRIKASASLLISIVNVFFLKCASIDQLQPENSYDQSRKLIIKADFWLNNGKYDQARQLLKQFITHHPDDPLVDDAEYRIAYLHVISDSGNPFLDYREAEKRFKHFEERYPESAYIQACNNWLYILNLYHDVLNENIKRIDVQNEPSTIGQLRKQNKELKEENRRLQKALSDLEKVLQR
ncbi:MAG: outer membrane protein assembly factor BamD [Caldithrix sp.]|nr:outer membrane protein assembly factor BamD [Caldithrix sp.]